MKKKVFTMILAGCMALSMAACSKKAAIETMVETTTMTSETTTAVPETTEAAKTTLTMGLGQDFLPMGPVGDDGECTSSDLELAAEVAERFGLEFVPQSIAWDFKDMELDSGNTDCIWNGLTITRREDDHTWITPCTENDQVFVAVGGSGIESWNNLAGRTIKAQADSSTKKVSQGYSELTANFGVLQATPDYNTALMDLEIGNTGAIAMDITVAGYQIGQGDADFVILGEPLAIEGYGVGLRLDNKELRDGVQGALEEVQADGTLKVISGKRSGKGVTVIG